MHSLKLICLIILRLLKQVWLVLKSVTAAGRNWPQPAVRNEPEAERLDRLRNPSKYLGK